MRTRSCRNCGETIDETQAEWDRASKTGKCPRCDVAYSPPFVPREALTSIPNTSEESGTGSALSQPVDGHSKTEGRRTIRELIPKLTAAIGVVVMLIPTFLESAPRQGLSPGEGALIAGKNGFLNGGFGALIGSLIGYVIVALLPKNDTALSTFGASHTPEHADEKSQSRQTRSNFCDLCDKEFPSPEATLQHVCTAHGMRESEAREHVR